MKKILELESFLNICKVTLFGVMMVSYRYFQCAPMFGLFAPQHKVTAISGGAGNSSSRRSSLVRYGDGSLSYHRASSQESISSIGSTSSASRGISGGRMRLGITSLSGQVIFMSFFHMCSDNNLQ